MAANRSDTFGGAMQRIWGRGGVLGCKPAPYKHPSARRCLKHI